MKKGLRPDRPVEGGLAVIRREALMKKGLRQGGAVGPGGAPAFGEKP